MVDRSSRAFETGLRAMLSLFRKIVRTGRVAHAARPGDTGPRSLLPEGGERLRGSLQIRQVDPGSCNGCEAEFDAVFGPVYDAERYGMRLAGRCRRVTTTTSSLCHHEEVVVCSPAEHEPWILRRGDRRAIVNIVQRGGTMLGTARSQRMHSDGGVADAVSALHELGIDALVVIGGDGSFRGAAALEAAGGPHTVGIPGTIDNDVVGSDVSLGFDTAVNTALDAIDRIRDTATSHEMLHFAEVMGRRCGAIALAAAVAGGAEAVLVPERPVSDDELARTIAASVAAGKRSVIVVVSEGARSGGAAEVARQVGATLGLDYRLTVLGHVQRGGRSRYS